MEYRCECKSGLRFVIETSREQFLLMQKKKRQLTYVDAESDLPRFPPCSHLNDNNFTGGIPETFSGLVSMKALAMQNNAFSGPLPPFVLQNWTNLTYL